MELFRDSQKKFLYRQPSEASIKKVVLVKTLFDECSNDNSPGGCFELFQNLKKMLADLQNIPEECAETAGAEPEVEKWLWQALKLMIDMAWGPKPPQSYMQKKGWFDSSELTLYCGLKHHAIRIYGQKTFSEWQEKILVSMPNPDKIPLDRTQAWNRSLLSTQCELYR